jgi:hypothetical protein
MSFLVEVYPEERGSAVVIGKKLYWLAILAPENLSSGHPCPKIKPAIQVLLLSIC